MKKIIPVCCFFLACAILLPCCAHSCDGENGYYQYDYYGVMNSDAVLKIYAERGDEEEENSFKELARKVGEMLAGVEKSLSAENPDSFISRFNAAAGGAETEIDYNAYKALSVAKEIYNLTGGAYNPAVYYSVKAYGFNGGEPPKSAAELPADEDIFAYAELSKAFGGVTLREEEKEGVKRYYAAKPVNTAAESGELALKIDLGGIGKGYAADLADGLIGEYGFSYGYFSFGSSSIAFKKYPDESSCYNLRISNPRLDGKSPQSCLTATVKDESVSTSGDNVNYFLLDSDGDGISERFCHIIDPFTGKPVQNGVISVTVTGGAAAENDALSTALMVMGKDGALKFINEKLGGRRVVMLCEEESGLSLYTTMALSEFTLDDPRYAVHCIAGGGDVA